MCKEAGGQLQRTGFLRETNLANVFPTDDRRVECVVNGLPPLGQQLAVDATLVSPLKGSGDPRPKAWHTNGAALADARKDKERRYPELLRGSRCRLVVVGMEVAGRWAEEAYYFLNILAAARAGEALTALRRGVHEACLKRWIAMVAVAGLRSFANSLLERVDATELPEGARPTLGQLLGQEPHSGETTNSRMPLR